VEVAPELPLDRLAHDLGRGLVRLRKRRVVPARHGRRRAQPADDRGGSEGVPSFPLLPEVGGRDRQAVRVDGPEEEVRCASRRRPEIRVERFVS
jgi:hypothetical protein